jgi:hypothetical protein
VLIDLGETLELTEINANIYLRFISPYIVPDVIGKELCAVSTFGRWCTGKHAVNVSEETGCAGCEVVSLVEIDAHGVHGGDTNDSNRLAMHLFEPEYTYLCH